MPVESRTSVVRRVLSWSRRMTGVQAAGLIAGIMLAVAMLYAVSAAEEASAGVRAPAPTSANGAFAARQAGLLLGGAPASATATPALPTATATATSTPPPTATATIALPPPTMPPPPPPAAPRRVEQQAPPPPPPPPTPVPPRAAPWGLDTSPMDGYAQALFDDTNRRRIGAGLPALRVNGWLIGIARIRSQDMADHHYFAHVSPITGDDAFSLMDKHGVPYGWAGENLAENNYPLGDTVSVADAALWNSPPHRENILNPNYTDMGIALAVDAGGMKYFTIIFTGPP